MKFNSNDLSMNSNKLYQIELSFIDLQLHGDITMFKYFIIKTNLIKLLNIILKQMHMIKTIF